MDIETGYGRFWDKLIEYELLKKTATGYVLSLDGYLAFAKDTVPFCDSAVMQLLVRFSAQTIFNTTSRDIEYREDYSGPGILVIEKLSQWAEKYIFKEQDRTQKNTEERYVIPFSLLKEAVVNAVVHRDYVGIGAFDQFYITDRYISVSNPTCLKNTSMENLNSFRSRSNPPNPRLARLFLDAHLMERSGSGMETFSRTAPKPVYDYVDHILSLKFGYSQENTFQLMREKYGESFTESDFAVYEFIRTHEQVTRKCIEEKFHLSRSVALRRLGYLAQCMLIQKNGVPKSKKIYYTVI